jgi:hypothetical protein
LPSELKTQLCQALATLDVMAIDSAIDAIRKQDAALGQALSLLAKQFQYRQILNLFQHSGDDASRISTG